MPEYTYPYKYGYFYNAPMFSLPSPPPKLEKNYRKLWIFHGRYRRLTLLKGIFTEIRGIDVRVGPRAPFWEGNLKNFRNRRPFFLFFFCLRISLKIQVFPVFNSSRVGKFHPFPFLHIHPWLT